MTGDAKFWRKTDSWFQKRHDKFGEFSPSYSKSKNFTLMGYFCSKYEVWATNIQTSYLSWHWTVTQNLIKPLQCGLRHLQELRFSRKLYSIHTTFQTLFPFFMSMARTTFYKVESKQTRTSNSSVQSNTFFFDNRKMTRACDDECCEFRVIHQIKFQRLIRGHHVFQNVWSLYKVETLTAQSDNRDEAQENDKYAVTRKTIIDQKNWLALNRLSFQSYCIILFKQVLEIISTLK